MFCPGEILYPILFSCLPRILKTKQLESKHEIRLFELLPTPVLYSIVHKNLKFTEARISIVCGGRKAFSNRLMRSAYLDRHRTKRHGNLRIGALLIEGIDLRARIRNIPFSVYTTKYGFKILDYFAFSR